jgi:hypothetical protein
MNKTSSNTEHIEEGESTLTSKTETNLKSADIVNRLQAALAATPQESTDPELHADFDDAVEDETDDKNEFVAPSGTRASIGGKTIIASDDDDDLSAFDPSNFVVATEQIAAAMPPRKLDYVALRKPSSKEYVRVCPSKEYRMSPVYLLTWKKADREVQYVILGKCLTDVLTVAGDVVKPYTIATAISDTGSVFLWPVREAGDDESNSWLESAQAVQASPRMAGYASYPTAPAVSTSLSRRKANFRSRNGQRKASPSCSSWHLESESSTA